MKLWKPLSLLLLLPALAFAGSDTGDYDGGGGGTLPAHPSRAVDIYNFIQDNAKRDLRLFVKYEMWSYDQGTSSPLEKKLFGGPVTLWDVLENTDIEVRMARPCYDKYGNEKDGSIYADRPGAICISAGRIAPKVMEETLRKEVLALILHELSHLLGTDEQEAHEFQGTAAIYLRETDRRSAKRFLEEMFNQVDATDNLVKKTLKEFDGLSDLDLGEAFSRINSVHQQQDGVDVHQHFSLLMPVQMDYQLVQGFKVMLATWYAKGLGTDGAANYWRNEYEKIFQGRDEVMAREIDHVFFRGGKNAFGDEKIRVLRSRADLRAVLEELQETQQELSNLIIHTREDLALLPPRRPGQNDFEPWDVFAGKYHVSETSCRSNGFPASAPTTFEVHRPSYGDGKLFLRVSTKNGWGDEGLYNGAGDILGGAVVSVSAGENFATRTSEFGTRWRDVWRKRSFRMERAPGGYQMIEKRYERRQDRGGALEYDLECVHKLEFISG